MTRAEIAAKASAVAQESARKRRFRRYIQEMQTHPEQVPAEFRSLFVPRPVDESKELATTQPSAR